MSSSLGLRKSHIAEKGNVTIEYCPTDDMVGDFHTKPLQGEKFRKFRNAILGCEA